MRAIEWDFDESRPPNNTFQRAAGTSVSTAFLGRSIASCINCSNQNFVERLDWPALAVSINAHSLSRLSVETVTELFERTEIASAHELKQLVSEFINGSNTLVCRLATLERAHDRGTPYLGPCCVLIAYGSASHLIQFNRLKKLISL
jgi:hypothetical protein